MNALRWAAVCPAAEIKTAAHIVEALLCARLSSAVGGLPHWVFLPSLK